MGSIRELQLLPSERVFVCPFCGKAHASRNGLGTDVSCCGEVGRSELNLCAGCELADNNCPIWSPGKVTTDCVEYIPE